LLLAAALPALAHHSTAPYDMTRPTTITGVVTRFQWSNPHSFVSLDVTEADGTVRHWVLELDAVMALRRRGWTKESLKIGDRITCTGARAKDPASYILKCFVVELPDGRKLHS
jgi:Family of unknown function (DUF6152)